MKCIDTKIRLILKPISDFVLKLYVLLLNFKMFEIVVVCLDT